MKTSQNFPKQKLSIVIAFVLLSILALMPTTARAQFTIGVTNYTTLQAAAAACTSPGTYTITVTSQPPDMTGVAAVIATGATVTLT